MADPGAQVTAPLGQPNDCLRWKTDICEPPHLRQRFIAVFRPVPSLVAVPWHYRTVQGSTRAKELPR